MIFALLFNYLKGGFFMMRKTNKKYRTKEQMLQDALIILNAPISYGTKYVVLDNICWLWSENQGKYEGCMYWSQQALKDLEIVKKLKESNKKFNHGDFFVHEHVVPRVLAIDMIINTENLNEITLKKLFDKYLLSAIITVKENKKLDSSGVKQQMPDEFYIKDSLNYNNEWIRYIKNDINIEKVEWMNGKIISKKTIF